MLTKLIANTIIIERQVRKIKLLDQKKVEKRKLSYNIKKAKEATTTTTTTTTTKNALNNCREKLLNMIPRFSIWKNNLESNIFLAIFQLLILCLYFLGKVEVVWR